MKIDLYIDFDGVILNTIDISYKNLKELEQTTKEKIDYDTYYKNLDWKKLIKESKQINNSINNIKKLIKSNLYNVYILSNVLSKEEETIKKEYLKETIPEIKLITVKTGKNKCDTVNCKNAILVDDYMGNLELWREKGGIPIKFSDNEKKHKCLTITNLDMLLNMYDEIKEIINISQK